MTSAPVGVADVRDDRRVAPSSWLAFPLPPAAVFAAVPVVRVIVCPLTGMSEVAETTVVPVTADVIVTVQVAVAAPPV